MTEAERRELAERVAYLAHAEIEMNPPKDGGTALVILELTEDEAISLASTLRQASGGWKPIESAPKDGTRILLSLSPVKNAKHTWGSVRIGKWRRGGWALDMSGNYQPDTRIMAWMPLPPPPTTEGG